MNERYQNLLPQVHCTVVTCEAASIALSHRGAGHHRIFLLSSTYDRITYRVYLLYGSARTNCSTVVSGTNIGH
jgi:hypothetical protein